MNLSTTLESLSEHAETTVDVDPEEVGKLLGLPGDSSRLEIACDMWTHLLDLDMF